MREFAAHINSARHWHFFFSHEVFFFFFFNEWVWSVLSCTCWCCPQVRSALWSKSHAICAVLPEAEALWGPVVLAPCCLREGSRPAWEHTCDTEEMHTGMYACYDRLQTAAMNKGWQKERSQTCIVCPQKPTTKGFKMHSLGWNNASNVLITQAAGNKSNKGTCHVIIILKGGVCRAQSCDLLGKWSGRWPKTIEQQAHLSLPFEP